MIPRYFHNTGHWLNFFSVNESFHVQWNAFLVFALALICIYYGERKEFGTCEMNIIKVNIKNWGDFLRKWQCKIWWHALNSEGTVSSNDNAYVSVKVWQNECNCSSRPVCEYFCLLRHGLVCTGQNIPGGGYFKPISNQHCGVSMWSNRNAEQWCAFLTEYWVV